MRYFPYRLSHFYIVSQTSLNRKQCIRKLPEAKFTILICIISIYNQSRICYVAHDPHFLKAEQQIIAIYSPMRVFAKSLERTRKSKIVSKNELLLYDFEISFYCEYLSEGIPGQIDKGGLSFLLLLDLMSIRRAHGTNLT
jgi:hypothetical protein